MTRIDEASFAAFCQTYARWLEVNTYLRDAPLLLESARGGLEINPAVKLLDQLQTAMMKAASEFGLSPGSRSKVTTNTVREDELGDFLGTGTNR
jgi:P27 family predicted phage terminase small subunit